jgi:lysophospholipase L1-like esterase
MIGIEILRILTHVWDRCVAKPLVRIWPKRAGMRILCFGDSNTWGSKPGTGLRYPYRQRWPGVLQMELGTNFVVREEGRNGRTTVLEDPDQRGCNGKPALRRCLRQHHPLDLVIILLGTNDLKTIFNRTAEQITQSVEELGRIVLTDGRSSAGASPILLLMAPPVVIKDKTGTDRYYGADIKSSSFAEQYRSVAERLGCEFFDTGTLIHSSMVDGIHWDQDAHQSLGKALAQRVTNLFVRVPSRNSKNSS